MSIQPYKIPPWTDEELRYLRRRTLADLWQHMRIVPKSVTCDQCPHVIKSKCLFVYDSYNTNGDCIVK